MTGVGLGCKGGCTWSPLDYGRSSPHAHPRLPPCPSLQVRELFNPDYGMFTVDERTHLHWFRPSLEATSSSEDLLDLDLEYELVGILIGE